MPISFPSAVAVPSTSDYAPKPVDFSWLKDLPKQYYSGRQMQRQDDLASAFPNGLPTDAQGNPDYQAIANVLATKGNIGGAVSLAPQMQMQQAGQISPLLSGGAAPMQAVPGNAGPNLSPQAGAPIVTPAAVPNQSPPVAMAAGNTDQPMTVGTMVSSLLGGIGNRAATVAQNIARAVGVPQDAPLNPQQQQRVYALSAGYAARNNLGSVSNFTPVITAAAQQYGLDPTLFNRQIAGESNFNPDAVSPKGAQGIAQFMPATARDYGVNARDPYSSIDGAARYMADLKQKFGNDGLALAAYNWGPQNVDNWLKRGADPRQMPAETRNYVQKVSGQPIGAWLNANAAGAQQNASAQQAGQRLTPQVPLPQGYNDPQQADLALRSEAARLSANPYNQGQVKALNDWAERIEASQAPLKIGERIVSPTGQVLFGTDKPIHVAPGSTLLNPNTMQPIYTAPSRNGLLGEGREQTIDSIADGIKSGNQPPNLTGLYGMSGPVRAKLQQDGFNLAQAQVEWKRAERQIAALNGAQMTRFVGLANSVDRTMDEVRELSQQMKMSGVPLANKAEIMAYVQTRGNTPNGQLATRYIGAINTLKEEFANLAQGGYAPTEPVWHLANRQINENFGVDQMDAALSELQRLIRYRVQAIPGLSQVGPAAGNRYVPNAPQNAAPAAGNAERAPATTSPAAASSQPNWTTLPNGIRIREIK